MSTILSPKREGEKETADSDGWMSLRLLSASLRTCEYGGVSLEGQVGADASKGMPLVVLLLVETTKHAIYRGRAATE